MEKSTKASFLFFLLLCSCGEVNNIQKKEANNENTAPIALSDKQLNLTISQQTQQACSADNVTLRRDHLATLRGTIKNLITQAGTIASEKPWNCAVSLADDIQNHLQKQLSPPKDVRYDLVVIGAGVQASILNAALWEKIDQQKSDLSVLFIDQNPDGGAQHFRTYIFNAASSRTGNDWIQQAPVQPIDFTAIKMDPPPAYAIWAQTAMTHFVSRSHFVFGKRVQGIELVQSDSSNRQYKVHVDSMPTIHTSAVVIAAGLGTPKFPEESDFMWLAQQHQQAVSCQTLSCVPTVLTFENMIFLERQLNMYGYSILTALKDKSVAILGSEASGSSTRQFLEDQAHPRAYQYASTLDRPRHIQQFSGGSNRIQRLGQAKT
ncbi:MAG: hypothetical protein AAF320_05175, partial [Myxococcota bacterium]